MKKTIVLISLVTALSAGGYVLGQTSGGAAAQPAAKGGAAPATARRGGGPGMEPGMCMGGGRHMMDHMGGGCGCPMHMIAAPGTRIDVKNAPKGVTITVTADDPKLVTRIQKSAEIMRLQHELMSQPE